MDAIRAIAECDGLPVTEDAAQSAGTTYKGRRTCGLSTIGGTSKDQQLAGCKSNAQSDSPRPVIPTHERPFLLDIRCASPFAERDPSPRTVWCCPGHPLNAGVAYPQPYDLCTRSHNRSAKADSYRSFHAKQSSHLGAIQSRCGLTTTYHAV